MLASARSRTVRVIRSAVDGFSDDELMTRAAALAFYAALSVAPLLLLLVWLIATVNPDWQYQLVEALNSVVGEKAASVLVTVIQSAKEHPRLGNIAGIIGLGVTLFSASAVFAQLQGTLDRVWHVKAKPGEAVGAWLRARARAFALLIGVTFLLIVSFTVSALIEGLLGRDGTAWSVMKYAVSVLVFLGAFGMMFKVLPDALIDWSDAIVGSVLTTALFLLGEFAIGLYVGHSDVGGAYGPAGALVVLLVWMYYSSLIVLMGSELTRGVAEARGKGIRPSPHAVQIEAAPAEVRTEKPRPSTATTVAYRRRATTNAVLVASGIMAGLLVSSRRRTSRQPRR